MSSPFVAEVRMFGFTYAPKGWAFCNGQILAISQNTALFSLLGVNYGGNGTSNFGLPNLQGAFPITSGQAPGLSSYSPGQVGGAATVTLNAQQMPVHTHSMVADATAGTVGAPSGAYLAQLPFRNQNLYGANSSVAAMAATTLSVAGGGGPHNNMSPYQALNFCIALQGVFPPRQ